MVIKVNKKDITNFQTSRRCREIWRNDIRFDIEQSGKLNNVFMNHKQLLQKNVSRYSDEDLVKSLKIMFEDFEL